MSVIRFFCDGVTFQLKGKRKISNWLKQVAAGEGKKIGSLSYVFVSDEIILAINNRYLQHDYYTDIITFDNSTGDSVSGEMYISVDTVKINAKDYHVDFLEELFRVMVHGMLHLCGYKDNTETEQQIIREMETKYLNIQKKVLF